MFSVTIAGEGDDAIQKISSVLRGSRFRVETLVERRANARRSPADGLVVVSTSFDRSRTTKAVVDARRDDDVRFLPFCLVARVEKSAATAFGAKALVRFDGPPEELVTELRRMLLREQESAVLVHQLEGEIGPIKVGEVVETLARGRRDGIVRVVHGAARGTVTVRSGNVIGATFDAATGRAALASIFALARGRFRVELRTVDDTDEVGALDVQTARAVLDRVDGTPRTPGPARNDTVQDEHAPVAALAAAIMNSVTAYARRWLGDTVVAHELEGARLAAVATAPSLAAFRVSSSGMIVVERVSIAAEGGGRALGLWIGEALARFEVLRPGRFGKMHATEIVGGLGRLLDQVGWRTDLERALFGGIAA